MTLRPGRIFKITVGALAIGLFGLWLAGLIPTPSFDRAQIQLWIEAAGIWGPVVIVALMTVAIVASPVPSAPIALAAGAAYGHFAGTIIVLIGAELGALVAFLIARYLGRDIVEKWFGDHVSVGLLGSQNALMLLVFASRLLPFVSFDLISYAAGLSILNFWRFAVATFAGIMPASFLLAHLGSKAMNGDATTAAWTAAILGAFTFISVGGAAIMRRRKKSASNPGANGDDRHKGGAS